MKTLKEIRDVLKNNYKNHSCQQRQNEDVEECWQALDKIIASIPDGLGEIVKLHAKAIKMNDHVFAPYVYDLYQAAKLLHSLNGGENETN